MSRGTRIALFVAGAAAGAALLTAVGLSAADEFFRQQNAKYGSGRGDEYARMGSIVWAVLGAGLGLAVAGLLMAIGARFTQHRATGSTRAQIRPTSWRSR